MNTPQLLRRWWIYPLAIVFVLIVVFSIFQSGESRRRLALSDFVVEVKRGNVTEAELDGRTLSYRLEDAGNTVFETELARGDSITSLLQDEGIPISEQPRITIDESRGFSSIIGLVLSFLPLLFLLGLLFFFLRPQWWQRWRWQLVGLVMNVDPVCGTTVNPGSGAGTSTFQGISYQFCSAQHKQQFDQDPVKYLLQK